MKHKLKDPHPESLLDNSAFLIMDVGRLYRTQFDQKARRLGLSRSEWWLIAHLVFFNGKTQQELADILDITKGGMTKLLDRLEQKGLIERRAVSSEGRATKCVYFTAKGRSLALKVDAASVELVGKSESLLSPEQVAGLHQLLRSLRAVLLLPATG